jgi:hypothetical protein
MSQMSANGVLCPGAEAGQSYPVGTQIAITQEAMKAKERTRWMRRRAVAMASDGEGDAMAWSHPGLADDDFPMSHHAGIDKPTCESLRCDATAPANEASFCHGIQEFHSLKISMTQTPIRPVPSTSWATDSQHRQAAWTSDSWGYIIEVGSSGRDVDVACSLPDETARARQVTSEASTSMLSTSQCRLAIGTLPLRRQSHMVEAVRVGPALLTFYIAEILTRNKAPVFLVVLCEAAA